MAEKKKMEVAKTLVSGSIFKAIAFISTKALSVVFYYIALRLLPPEQAGYFFVASAVLGIATTIPTVGIPASVTRYVAFFSGKKEFSKIRPFFERLYKITLIISLALTVLILVSAGKISEYYGMPLTEILWVTGIASSLSLISCVLLAYLDGRKFFFENAVVVFIQNTSRVFIALLLIFLVAANALNLTFAVLGSFGLSAIAAYWFVQRDINKLKRGSVSNSEIKESIFFGIPYYVTNMAELVSNWTDTLFIGFFMDAPSVAAYSSVGLIVRNVAPLITAPIMSVQSAVLAESYGNKSAHFKGIVSNGTKWMVYLGLPFAVGLAFYRDLIMQTLFPLYVGNSYLFLILLPACMMIIVSASARSSLFAVGRSDLLLRVGLLVVFPNIILNYLWIPTYGLGGAAAATAVSVILAESLALHYAFKNTGLRISKDTWKSLIATAVMVVVIYALGGLAGSGLLVSIPIAIVGAGVYFAALILTGGFSTMDWALIGKARERLFGIMRIR